MGTKLIELRDGCFHAALDDEPMFVLLARDPDAPRLCRNWASQRESEIKRGARPASDAAKVQEARETADRMDKWRKANDGAWGTGLFAGTPAAPQPDDERKPELDDDWFETAEAFVGDQPVPVKTARHGIGSYADVSGIVTPMYGGAHHVRQESDEYACSCGMRWPVSEGEDHP